jgi:hypothetical protein
MANTTNTSWNDLTELEKAKSHWFVAMKMHKDMESLMEEYADEMTAEDTEEAQAELQRLAIEIDCWEVRILQLTD